MLNRTRRLAAAMLIAPTVLVAAACGNADTPAASGTQGAESSTMTSATSTAEAQHYTDKAAFVAALKAGATTATSSHVEMTMKGAKSTENITMQGDMKVDAKNPAMKVTMDLAGAPVEMVLVDRKIYMKGIPGTDTTKWMSFDSSSAVGKQMASSLALADPSKMYDEFDNGLTDVKYEGTETVDGEQLAKYTLTLDSAKLSGLDTSGGKLPKTIDYLVWLDAKDHMRKLTFELQGTSAEILMSKYGEPVDVTAPPAKDVVKAPAGM